MFCIIHRVSLKLNFTFYQVLPVRADLRHMLNYKAPHPTYGSKEFFKLGSMCFFGKIVYCIVLCIYTQHNISMYYMTHYMTHPTVQVQPNSQVIDIPLTERQKLKDDHLSMSLRFFSHFK